jgi:hypothetical protein
MFSLEVHTAVYSDGVKLISIELVHDMVIFFKLIVFRLLNKTPWIAEIID